MAYTKITPIKSGTHIENALDYIENPLKTDGQLLVSSYMCSYKNAFSEFADIAQFAMKKGNNIAHHIVQSFSPEDNMSPEQAIEIGRELMKRMYPEHQYVLATHIDRGHIHNHIIVNAVDFVNYKKIHSNKESLSEMRKKSDEICIENGLTVIKPTSHSQRKKLTDDIDEAIEKVSSFDDFLGYMQEKNYEIKSGKSYSFKAKDGGTFLRLTSLGSAYSERNIKKRIEDNAEIQNKKKYVYDDKTIKMSYRKRLRMTIDRAVKKSNTYDDFLNYMLKDGYEVKQGKHLAFRYKNGSRFQRSKSLGDDYDEYILRLRIENVTEYERLKAVKEKYNIDKVNSSANSYYGQRKNIDMEIKTLMFLKENNIKDFAELDRMIDEMKEKINSKEQDISNIKSQISAKYDIINSLRIYWQYKPLADEARSITDKDKRKEFMQQHKEQMDKFKRAIDIMNTAREEYGGKIPNSEQLHKEIDILNEKKDDMISENVKPKEELKRLINVKYNTDWSVGNISEKEIKVKKQVKDLKNK